MLLDEIKNLLGNRQHTYLHPLPNHLLISLEWSLEDFPYVHNPISVAKKMIGLKLRRDYNRSKEDNFRDSIGYVVCIDLMRELYWNLSEFEGNYNDLGDNEKDVLTDTLKNMGFYEQYQLLKLCYDKGYME